MVNQLIAISFIVGTIILALLASLAVAGLVIVLLVSGIAKLYLFIKGAIRRKKNNV